MFIPEGFHTVTPYLFASGAPVLLEFLCAAFGGEEVHCSEREDGSVANAQLRIGSSMMMVSEATDGWPVLPCSFYLYVEDADASVQWALDCGASLEMAVMDMPYGDRQGGVRDPAGNIWWVSQHNLQFPAGSPGRSGAGLA